MPCIRDTGLKYSLLRPCTFFDNPIKRYSIGNFKCLYCFSQVFTYLLKIIYTSIISIENFRIIFNKVWSLEKRAGVATVAHHFWVFFLQFSKIMKFKYMILIRWSSVQNVYIVTYSLYGIFNLMWNFHYYAYILFNVIKCSELAVLYDSVPHEWKWCLIQCIAFLKMPIQCIIFFFKSSNVNANSMPNLASNANSMHYFPK